MVALLSTGFPTSYQRMDFKCCSSASHRYIVDVVAMLAGATPRGQSFDIQHTILYNIIIPLRILYLLRNATREQWQTYDTVLQEEKRILGTIKNCFPLTEPPAIENKNKIHPHSFIHSIDSIIMFDHATPAVGYCTYPRDDNRMCLK